MNFLIKKTYEITINEGTAPNKKVLFNCECENSHIMNTSEIITSAVAHNAIQTKDVRWIESVKDVSHSN